MKNKAEAVFSKNLKQILLLVLITLAVLSAALPAFRASAIQQSESELIAQANAAVANARAALSMANAKDSETQQRLSELKEFSTFQKPDQQSLISLRRLTTTVSNLFDETAERQTLQAQLDDAQTKLTAAKTKLNTAKTALDAATSTPGIEAAKTSVNTQLQNLTAAPDLPGLVTRLNTNLGAIYGRVLELPNKANTQIAPLKQSPAEPADLLNLLTNQLDKLPLAIQFDLDLRDAWNNLSTELKKVVSDHDTKSAPVNTAISTLHDSVTSIANNLKVQLGTLATYTERRQGELLTGSVAFTGDPKSHEREALQNISEALVTADTLDRLNRIVDPIRGQAETAGFTGFDATKTKTAQGVLTDKVNTLRVKASEFQELFSGDRSLWVTEKIRLYYFTDVPRLVRTLNPTASLTGGDTDARRRAEERLERLRATEDAQSEANAAVASLKRRVENMRQQLQQANAQLDLANTLAEAANRRDADLNRRPAADIRPGQKELSAEEKNKRERERAAAQQRADALNNEQSGLAAQLAEAETNLETAQAAFERASSATIRAAQAESAAFANARDNAAFWFAGASATSTDPAKRVEITSSTGGENAIFVRGRREDVAKVKDIVSKLDEPAPQARMTLWKIELNSDATPKGAERFNKSLAIVERNLAETRAKIALSLALLLEAINQQAEVAAGSSVSPSGERVDCEEISLYEKYGFKPDRITTDITGGMDRRRRYALYSDQVLKELGIGFIDMLGYNNPKLFGLKDPASATTLNEALIVLLLASRTNREAIIKRFEEKLKTNLGKDFSRLHAMLKPDNEYVGSSREITRQQQELVYAIRGLLLKHLIGRVAHMQARVQMFTALHRKQAGTETSPAVSLTDGERKQYLCLQEKLPYILDTINSEFLVSPSDVLEGRIRLEEPGDGTIGLRRYRGDTPVGPAEVYNLRPSPARVAAADGMLDVFTKAFEDDIDREFVQPMLGSLRDELKKTGIGFGVIQRTSVLATNRVVARVDPRATAELSVGEETNLIQGLQQIAQLTLDAKTGNVGGVLGRFNELANEPNKAEIYGITSGSAFQVTPIFDPTGQALRFKFDFVDTTLVREPRGTVNARLPRVERHTVNTEVQLGNLEIREVSRFESDSKIGLPTTYRGGLPILKDIPGVRPIPLIGWFIRRKGSNAIAQRSLIFAQTTMSPTIGDILDLLDTSLQRR
ncbi:MAG TPA: hypothetical protein VFI24_04425 [Pyrinomonadaceae bacterium]|nr:hypothetical protein [Pyrinomonadaceae bacterium]